MGYFRSTRHPWPCLLFLLPLLAVYEGGVLSLGVSDHSRATADQWLRWLIENFGVSQFWTLPLALLVWMVLWTAWKWDDRPKDGLGLWLGMALESVGFGLVLWAVQANFDPLMRQFGVTLSAGGLPEDEAMKLVVFYFGAGIYEEVLFRMILLGALAFVLRLFLIPGFLAIPMALVVSAVAFSAAHHIGQPIDSIDHRDFAFRVVAGLFFGLLYQFRGIGIAIGAHAAYDVIVGVPWG